MKPMPLSNSITDTTSPWSDIYSPLERRWMTQLLELLSSEDQCLGTGMTALRRRLLDYAVTGLATYAASYTAQLQGPPSP